MASACDHPTPPQLPRPGLCCTLGGVCPAPPYPFHLGLLRDVKRSAAVCPPCSPFSPAEAGGGGRLLEPSQSLPLCGVTLQEHLTGQRGGVSPPVTCASAPGLLGGIPEGMHPLRTPQGTLCSAPQTLRLNSGPAAVLIPQSHLQVAVEERWFSIPRHPHAWGGSGMSCVSPGLHQLGTSQRPRLEALDGPLPITQP